MQIHQIQLEDKDKYKSKKRVGRGGKKGTYSGRGMKGQKSRAGAKIRPQLRDIVKKIPKKRGYRFNLQDKNIIEINLNLIDKLFQDNEEVNIKSLIEKGLLKKGNTRDFQIKILGKGDISKKVIIKDCILSKNAKAKIEKAGGKIINKNE
ncbi:MAG: 50S ribosomal protein L15 [Candidatus Pacebacteria bacterium]|nr:50S ribosomal protein L15 [Candidatus Paceibacterota bacterium]